jgi:glycosyltransferase involved in cell wall biosynthesis
MPDQIQVSHSVSVAMCIYNGARFLPKQLESIAAQTRLPDELVVCDDGSADESAEIIRKFATSAPFPVRLEINEKNLGATKNFEKAIGLCQGDLISLADQDDVWKPQRLSKLWRTLQGNPRAGYAFSNADLIDQRGSRLGRDLWDSVRFHGSLHNGFFAAGQVVSLVKRAAATGATMTFRASLKNILLPISPCFVHDYWISLLASCVGWYGVPIPESLIEYRQHEGQQIGALRNSILEKVRWARQVGPAEYSNRTQGYLDLRERLLLAAANGWTCPPNHMDLVEEKIEHLSHRAVAHSKRGTARLGRVFSEVITGRYGRFSNSWVSVVEDLCF